MRIFYTLLVLFTTASFAQPARILKDINEESLAPTRGSNFITSPIELNGRYYFISYTMATGTEVFSTDGTGEGTTLLKDITPGNTGTQIFKMSKLQNSLIIAGIGVQGPGIWKSDGTAEGTQLLKSIPGADGYIDLTAGDNLIYIIGAGEYGGQTLWKSDGTADGTIMIKDLPADDAVRISTDGSATIDDKLFFFLTDPTVGLELWTSDGTSQGTMVTANINSSDDGNNGTPKMRVSGSSVYFIANNDVNGDEIWRSDGTSENTTMVTDQDGEFLSGSMTTISDYFLLRMSTESEGVEYWVYNRISEDLSILEDINPGNSWSTSESLPGSVLLNNIAYFIAYDPTNKYSLWKTDGSTANTSLVFKLNLEPGTWPVSLTAGSDNLFLTLSSTDGNRLTSSNGTTPFTTLKVGPLNYYVYPIDDRAMFAYDDGQHGLEPWITDGTSSGTRLLTDLNRDPISGTKQVLKLNDRILVLNLDPEQTYSLWSSDGTQGGTVKIKTFSANELAENPYLEGHGSKAVVISNCCNDGVHVWITDGTTKGTFRIEDLSDQANTSDVTFSLGVGWLGEHALLLDADSRLWKTDGTPGGTQVSEVSMPPLAFWWGAAFKDNFYFFKKNALWKTDGTSDGTVEIVNLFDIGYESDYLDTDITALRDRIVFPVYGSNYMMGASDGTAEGTYAFKMYGFSFFMGMDEAFVAEDGYFLGTNSDWSENLWRTDGTQEGTYRATNDYLNNITVIARVDNTIYFSASDQSHGLELWKMEEGSTDLVKDINPGFNSSSPDRAVVFNGKIYFVADDGTHGRELWVTDGTIIGTKLVTDTYPGAMSAFEAYGWPLATRNSAMFFPAIDPVFGREAWLWDGQEPPGDGEEPITGIATEETFETSLIWPNPTTSTLFIDGNLRSALIRDMLGRDVITTTESVIDVSHLPRGMYVITIKSDTDVLTSRKILLK